MPKSYPDFPHHTQIAAYFDSYVDHFGFRDRIRFETSVERAERGPHGGWTLTLHDGSVERFDALLVANGHHWNPRWPEPAFPGSDTFAGEQLHAHSYVDNELFRGRDALVLGIGNSAMDIAVEASYVADRTVPRRAPRRVDHPQVRLRQARPTSSRRTRACRSRSASGSSSSIIRLNVGDLDAVRPAQARPPLRRGAPDGLRAPPRPHPARHDHAQAEHRAPRRRVRRVRRRHARARRRRRLLHGLQDHVPVLRRGPHLRARQPHRAVPPRLPPRARRRLAFVGLLQPLGAIMPLPRRRGSGSPTTCAASTRCRRPPSCASDIRRDQAAMRKRYVASKRHTIQVDFDDYLHALQRERRAGAQRARAAASACPCPAAPAPRRRRCPRDASPPPPPTAAGARPRSRPTARRSSPRRARSSPRSATARPACATSSGAPTWPPAPSTTTSPTRSRCSARSSTTSPSRRAGACARPGRTRRSLRGVRRRGLPRLLRLHRRGPGDVRAHAPQRGHDPRDVRRARARRRHRRAARRPASAGVAAGAIPPHDTELMAAAMVGAGIEVGVKMVERDRATSRPPCGSSRACSSAGSTAWAAERRRRTAPCSAATRGWLACWDSDAPHHLRAPLAFPERTLRKERPPSCDDCCSRSPSLLALLAVPSSASAAFTLGVSDQQAGTFDNPLFKPLKFRAARYIAPYDAMSSPEDEARLRAWMAGARRANQQHPALAGALPAPRPRAPAAVGRRVHARAAQDQARVPVHPRVLALERGQPLPVAHARRRPADLRQAEAPGRVLLRVAARVRRGRRSSASTCSTSRTSTRRSPSCASSCASPSHARRSSASTTTPTPTASPRRARSACCAPGAATCG